MGVSCLHGLYLSVNLFTIYCNSLPSLMLDESLFTFRINTYRDSTLPVVAHYRSQNLVADIPADKQPDDVSLCTNILYII